MIIHDYKTRVFIVFSLFVVFFLVIMTRLFLLQISQHDFFSGLAEQQYAINLSVKPPRALIYDRNKKLPLAFNLQTQSAFVVTPFTDPAVTIPFLKKKYPQVYARMQAHSGKHFFWLDRFLSEQKYNVLKEKDFRDIHFLDEHQRYYPYQELTAALIGLTDIDNSGIAGLELFFNKQLAGTESQIWYQRDARSGQLYFNQKIQQRGKKGTQLISSIDTTLQAIAYDELSRSVNEFSAIGGACLILNPETGEVLSLTTFPTVDPNQKPLPSLDLIKNTALCDIFELGSVMKAFCALAAFQEKVVGFEEPIDCEGRFAYINGFKIENPTIQLLNILAEHNNILPFCDVVRYSSNVGVAKVAQRLGPKLYTNLRRLGFGNKTNVTFPGERAGFVNSPERWSRSSLTVMSFGYEIMASLIQLAKAFCIVANGGHDITPTLIKQEKACMGKQLFATQAVGDLKNIMEKVCGKYSIPSFRILGKTGTARCIKDGHYTNSALRCTFAGIIEKGSYKRVVITFINEPQARWASDVAMPLFWHIAQRMIVQDMYNNVIV